MFCQSVVNSLSEFLEVESGKKSSTDKNCRKHSRHARNQKQL